MQSKLLNYVIFQYKKARNTIEATKSETLSRSNPSTPIFQYKIYYDKLTKQNRIKCNIHDTNLTKAEKIHQPNKPTCLITANMSCAIYLCYFLSAKL